MTNQYTPKEWAELFVLCANVEDMDDTESPHYIETFDKVWEWLCEYARVHNLPQPEESFNVSDTRIVIREALSFLKHFANNHYSNTADR